VKLLCLAIVLLPLLGATAVGLAGDRLRQEWSHWITIPCVGLSCLLSAVAYKRIVFDGAPVFNEAVYTWLESGDLRLEIGFLVDPLSVTLMTVVTFVSCMIHIYTVGYMRDDPGYRRFFSYISLFTFAMLMLVMANNFLQLFFGWEAVGLVSYLLIGFWFQRESAIAANLKAFLVNRVGDFGFLLGIAAVLALFGSLDYAQVFAGAPYQGEATVEFLGAEWPLLTTICVCLFVGAMGKSAQMPLHVWLPDSMEGPTPISALIHAATMVTAGIFMVARMSPLYEMSETALSLVLVVGALTALLTGLLGIVQHDIKRVIAYSTLSQLGYMTVALGASAYAAAIFHLVTHAFFKALLFLAAGSVIVALHHEQDMRRMGGLYRHMPITWFAMLAGALALIGLPGTSGFYSKDAIIEAVRYCTLPGAGFAGFAVTAGVAVTAIYTFRMFFLAFHGQRRASPEASRSVQESPRTITIPLLVLAVPSLVVGIPLIEPMLFGDYFRDSIQVLPEHDTLARVGENFRGIWSFAAHALTTPPVFLAAASVLAAWYCYLRRPELPAMLARGAQWPYRALVRKYGFDELYQALFARGAQGTAQFLWRRGDVALIDGFLVNGAASAVRRLASAARRVQTGYLYHYAFTMIVGLLLLLGFTGYGLL